MKIAIKRTTETASHLIENLGDLISELSSNVDEKAKENDYVVCNVLAAKIREMFEFMALVQELEGTIEKWEK